MELNIGGWRVVEPFSANSGAVPVLRSNYVVSLLSGSLLQPYHGFYIRRFYRDDLLTVGSTQSKEWRDIVKLENKYFCSNRELFLRCTPS